MQPKEITARSGWRLAVTWLFVVASAGWLSLCGYIVITGIATIGEVTGIVISIFTGLGTSTGLYVHGRSRERISDKLDDFEDIE